jgi:hypothetical protein
MTFDRVVAVIVVAMLLVAVVGTARFAWRIFHDNEEMVPGGSLSRQFLGRTRGKRDRRGRKRRAG